MKSCRWPVHLQEVNTLFYFALLCNGKTLTVCQLDLNHGSWWPKKHIKEFITSRQRLFLKAEKTVGNQVAAFFSHSDYFIYLIIWHFDMNIPHCNIIRYKECYSRNVAIAPFKELFSNFVLNISLISVHLVCRLWYLGSCLELLVDVRHLIWYLNS